MIFVTTIALAEPVRVDQGKPTAELYRYVVAPKPEALPRVVRNWCDEIGVPFAFIRGHKVAQEQNLHRYQNPKEIIGVAA